MFYEPSRRNKFFSILQFEIDFELFIDDIFSWKKICLQNKNKDLNIKSERLLNIDSFHIIEKVKISKPIKLEKVAFWKKKGKILIVTLEAVSLEVSFSYICNLLPK